jgi:hypothetical protein
MTKVSRNDPCSCGSGKKFKKCCEGKIVQQNRFHAEEGKERHISAGLFKRAVSQNFSEKKEES